jgi:Integrase core domain
LPHLDAAAVDNKKKFKSYPIGYFHIDLTEVRTKEGKLFLFVAIDRTSKFAFACLVKQATRRAAANFLNELIKAIPCRIHTPFSPTTALTSPLQAMPDRPPQPSSWQCNGVKSSWLMPSNTPAPAMILITGSPSPITRWTNGQVERMNRTIKEATVQTYHYENHAQLQEHLIAFINAYNFARRLKTLAGFTPYQFICSCWQKQSHLFKSNPHHHSPGLYS